MSGSLAIFFFFFFFSKTNFINDIKLVETGQAT